MTTPQITFVYDCETGDWTGLYLNGKLVYEGHTIEAGTVLDKLDIKYIDVPFKMPDSRLPSSLNDVLRVKEIQGFFP